MEADPEPLTIGRYALFDALASGGMATVHLGRLLGPEGFGRTVAIKRLHQHYTSDADFVTMFLDEARIVARIRHPNVVPMIDVIQSHKGLFLVMEYAHGESLSKLLRTCRTKAEPVPLPVAAAILHGVLLGLHAAHETKGSEGELLDVVHRDVSPQNLIIGADGIASVLDFGVAKAAGRAQVTREGQIKGKLAYMAPEQIRGRVDRRADVFAASVVLWETLTGRRFHDSAKDVDIVTRVVTGDFKPPGSIRPEVPAALDALTMRGLEVDPAKRWPNAREMALELEKTIGLASPSDVSAWVHRHGAEVLRHRAERVAAMERAAATMLPTDTHPPPGPEEERSQIVAPVRGSVHSLVSEIMESGATPPHGENLSGRREVSPPPEPRREGTAFVALLSFCLALAFVGLLLGGWSLYARRSVGPLPPAITAPPRVLPLLPGLSSGVLEPALAPSASALVAPAPTPARTVTTAAGAEPAPRRAPAPSAAPPAPKKNCDPPYTVDESGHKQYKRECFD